MSGRRLTYTEEIERCVRSAQAVNQHYVDLINRHVEEAITLFTEAGMSRTAARKLAEQWVGKALNDVAEENFRGPRR